MQPAPAPSRDTARLDMPDVLARVATASARPRYTFMVLNLIARVADASGSAGPYVCEKDRAVPIRDWLCDAMSPMAARDHRRVAIVAQAEAALAAEGRLPLDPDAARAAIDREVRERVRASGRTAISRAVSELVKAGLVRRHYQGYRVDHANRGAQRQAVYTVLPAVRAALGRPGVA
jgi:hypothetical protein